MHIFTNPDLINLTVLTPATAAISFSLHWPATATLETSQLGKEDPSQEGLILKTNIFMLRTGLELVFIINFFMN